jgi:hypothetical protein
MIDSMAKIGARMPWRRLEHMDLIHAREFLHDADIVIVNCSHPCKVRVMDDANYQSYRSGGLFKYYGGYYRMPPVRIAVPHDGHWNVTIDLDGGLGNIRYNINYLKLQAA